MPKYEVRLKAQVESTLFVSASSEEEAIDEAEMLFEFETNGTVYALETTDVIELGSDADFHDFDDDGD